MVEVLLVISFPIGQACLTGRALSSIVGPICRGANHTMNAKLKALVFIALGVSLFVVGINMKYAVNQWNEITVA